MRVAASSPAWFTRRAESRNSRWVLERGRRRFAVESELRLFGVGSVDGGAAEVVIDA